MKKVILASLFALSLSAQATVDGHMNMFIMVRDINSGEYFMEKAPLIGCWGLPKGPELLQLTREYQVANLGCGSVTKENINALTCAKVTDSVEADDYSTFKEITLDISNCDDKNNEDFLSAVKKVVKLNFASKSVKNPKLNLIK